MRLVASLDHLMSVANNMATKGAGKGKGVGKGKGPGASAPSWACTVCSTVHNNLMKTMCRVPGCTGRNPNMQAPKSPFQAAPTASPFLKVVGPRAVAQDGWQTVGPQCWTCGGVGHRSPQCPSNAAPSPAPQAAGAAPAPATDAVAATPEDDKEKAGKEAQALRQSLLKEKELIRSTGLPDNLKKQAEDNIDKRLADLPPEVRDVHTAETRLRKAQRLATKAAAMESTAADGLKAAEAQLKEMQEGVEKAKTLKAERAAARAAAETELNEARRELANYAGDKKPPPAENKLVDVVKGLQETVVRFKAAGAAGGASTEYEQYALQEQSAGRAPEALLTWVLGKFAETLEGQLRTAAADAATVGARSDQIPVPDEDDPDDEEMIPDNPLARPIKQQKTTAASSTPLVVPPGLQ